MTPEAQQIAIAEACGIREYPDFGLRDSRMVQVASSWDEWDPLNDLNAMHEAEKVLDGHPKRDDFGDYLAQIVLGFGPEKDGILTINVWSLRRILHATAAQRAEAFLRTIGKWAEDSGK